MIYDSHNHLGYRKGVSFPIDELIKWLDESGVTGCVVTTHPEAIDNDYVANAQKEYPDRIFGFAVANPWDYKADAELERCFSQLNLYGLKLNPLRHGYALDRHEIVDSLFEICEKYDKPVLVHGQSDLFNMPGKFDEMARAFPKVKIIAAHIGEPDGVDAMIRYVNKHENLYVDTAGIQLSTLVNAINNLSADKILMGTDAPWGKFELSIDLVNKATLDESKRKKIKGGNLLRLLKIKKD